MSIVWELRECDAHTFIILFGHNPTQRFLHPMLSLETETVSMEGFTPQSSVAKVWLCSALIYISLYFADNPVAADETCVRLMTLHPPIESFTFAKSSRFLDNSTPGLIDQGREKRKL